MRKNTFVIPAKAGIQGRASGFRVKPGMTEFVASVCFTTTDYKKRASMMAAVSTSVSCASEAWKQIMAVCRLVFCTRRQAF